MLNFKGLSLAICLTISMASTQYISAPQYFQDEVDLDDLSELPTERSLNYLSVVLPQHSKAESEATVHVKPIYIPVPVKDTYPKLLPYQAYQPNSFNYMPQQAMPTYQYQQPNPTLSPNPFLYSSINGIPPKYPLLFTPNKVQHLEYPNYTVPPPMPAFIKNPAPQLQQYPQHFNYTELLLKLLPQLMNGLTYYSTPLPQQEIFAEENDFTGNFEQLRTRKPVIVETNIKPGEKEPNLITLPEATLFTADDTQKIPTSKPPTQPTQSTQLDSSVLNLLQKLYSRRRVQERLGAVYLKDSLLNRK